MGLRAYTAVVVAAFAWTALPVRAQHYPNKPVTLVMPYPPGGGTDLIGRLIAQKLEQRLGQPVILDYRPGAGSAIAATYTARAPGDGYTILYATSTTMANSAPPAELAAFVKAEIVRWGEVVKQAGAVGIE